MKSHYQIEVPAKSAKKTAKALGVGVNASLKYSTEICNFVRGMPVSKVRAYLQRVIAKTDFVPLKRYHLKVPHRKGNPKSQTKSGRFPVSTAKVFLKLLESAAANADYKGLDAEKLVVFHAFACQAFGRPGFQSKGKIGGKRRAHKTCHIELILTEAA